MLAQEGAGREHGFGVNIRLPFEQEPNQVINKDPKLLTFRYFFTRKLMFIKEADAAALFPGGFGTHDEAFECLTLVQTGKTRPMPIVFVDAPRGTYWKTWKRYVEDHLLPAIEQHLAEVSANAHVFRAHLRGTGTFRPVSPVVFVGVVEGISGCEQLAFAVRRGPLAIDVEFPYHPHVTVAHHMTEQVLDRAFSELAGFECEFLVENFWLYVHDDQRGWIPTRDFPLTAAAD